MNIFALDEHPKEAAKFLFDQHVRKMLVESCQILSTVLWAVGPEEKELSFVNVREQIIGWEDFSFDEASDFIIGKIKKNTKKRFLYAPVNINNKFVEWASFSLNNWKWLYEHAVGITEEFNYRFELQHKASIIIWNMPPPNLPALDYLSPFPRCVFKDNEGVPVKNIQDILNTVEAYQEYYCRVKAKFGRYTKRNPPYWFMNKTESEFGRLIA